MHPSEATLEQVAQVKWQLTFTQFPLISNWRPDEQLQVKSLLREANVLQLVQLFTFALLQLSHLTWQALQFPLESIKYPLEQTQLFVESFTAFDLQVRQEVLVEPKQVRQVLWQDRALQFPFWSIEKPALQVH